MTRQSFGIGVFSFDDIVRMDTRLITVELIYTPTISQERRKKIIDMGMMAFDKEGETPLGDISGLLFLF